MKHFKVAVSSMNRRAVQLGVEREFDVFHYETLFARYDAQVERVHGDEVVIGEAEDGRIRLTIDFEGHLCEIGKFA